MGPLNGWREGMRNGIVYNYVMNIFLDDSHSLILLHLRTRDVLKHHGCYKHPTFFIPIEVVVSIRKTNVRVIIEDKLVRFFICTDFHSGLMLIFNIYFSFISFQFLFAFYRMKKWTQFFHFCFDYSHLE